MYLGPEDALYDFKVHVDGVNYVGKKPISTPMKVTAKIRYNGQEAPAVLYPGDPGEAVLVFGKAQRAITPGQATVFYDGDRVVGGGYVISAAIRSFAAAPS